MESFPRIETRNAEVSAWCVTPRHGRTLHRFYDTSPISPSGRFLVVTQLPYDDRLPKPGDQANIVLVDLHTGEEQAIATTAGWDTQLGAQAQWGVLDQDLFYADVNVEDWTVVTVKHNIFTGERQILNGPLYMLSPDGQTIAGPDLIKIDKTQIGYGVHVPRKYFTDNRGAPDDDGVYLTEASTGKATLFITLDDLVAGALGEAGEKLRKNGDFYAFHVKWNPQGSRMMIVLRWLARSGGARKNWVVTVRMSWNRDQWSWSEPRVAVPAEVWARGGHHPNWCPDGDTILMNLKWKYDSLRFCVVDHDGQNMHAVAPSCKGSGHPTMHPNGNLIITDCYRNEGFSDGKGHVPLRLVDIPGEREEYLLMLDTEPKVAGPGNAFRIDPHPAWNRSYQKIVFNGVYKGERRVFLADLSGVLA